MATAMANITVKLPMKGSSLGIFVDEYFFHLALPLLCLQMFVVVTLTRALAFFLTPLCQPRVTAEIVGAILLGPSALGCSKVFLDTLFPNESLKTLDLISNFGYHLFLFRVGLELNLNSLCRIGKHALVFAMAGIFAPFILGIGTSQVLNKSMTPKVLEPHFLIFMGVNLSVTAFPILARILNELELLNTDLGQMALSVAVMYDITAWILLVLSPPLLGTGSLIMSLWVLLNCIIFITVVAIILRPAVNWMARHSQGSEPVRVTYICTMLAAIPIASFVTDAIGIHALFGAFVVGITVPKEGPFASVLIEKLDFFISSLLPLYFVSSGLKTNIATISGGISWASLSIMIFNTCLGKVGGTIIASIALRTPFREAVTLGFLMNTKGIVEQIVLCMRKDNRVLNDERSIMVLIVLFIMFITIPIVMHVYKPVRETVTCKHRRIERKDTDSKLRVLACYHNNCSRPTIMTLMEFLRGNGCCELTGHALALMVLDDGSSTTSVAHKTHHVGIPLWKSELGNDIPADGICYQIVCEFRAYQQFSETVLHGLHDFFYQDVVSRAQQTHVSLIILPYPKSRQIDGYTRSFGGKFNHMNRRIFEDAPCSVALLVDRGLGFSEDKVSYSVVVLFFGGEDDREALAYGLHIAGYPGIDLTVIRFIPVLDSPIKERKMSSKDNECITRLLERVATDKDVSVKYEEIVLSGTEVIVSAIKYAVRCNLFLVGQCVAVPPLVSSTDRWDLGPVGSYMAVPYSTTASVLIFSHKDSSEIAAPLIKTVPKDGHGEDEKLKTK